MHWLLSSQQLIPRVQRAAAGRLPISAHHPGWTSAAGPHTSLLQALPAFPMICPSERTHLPVCSAGCCGLICAAGKPCALLLPLCCSPSHSNRSKLYPPIKVF